MHEKIIQAKQLYQTEINNNLLRYIHKAKFYFQIAKNCNI